MVKRSFNSTARGFCGRRSAVRPWLGRGKEPGTVSFIGAPLAGGQPIPGVEKAPQAMRDGGIANIIHSLGWDFHDVGDLDVTRAIAAGSSEMVQGVKNCEQVGFANKLVHDAVKNEAAKGNFVLTVGGDHSIGSATLTGMKSVYKDLSVIWVDAHGDCNTGTTSPSGNYHGMSASHAMGWFGLELPGFEWLQQDVTISDSRLAFIALRDIDENEKKLLRSSGVAAFTMYDIDRWGIGSVIDMALHRVNPHGNRPIHLSFDIDSCDPTIAPGTGTCSRGGLNFRESHYICETLALTNNLCSMDIVEINPDLDTQVSGRMHGDSELITTSLQTVRLGQELVSSALGRSIL